MPVSLGELATRFGCELVGDPDVVVNEVAALPNAGPNSLSFLSGAAFRKALPGTEAAAVILRAEDAADCRVACLVSENPYATYALMAAVIHPPKQFEPGVHPSAVVAPTAKVARTAHVAANAVVEDGVAIGEHSSIGPGAVVGPNCRVGDHCRIHANVTLVRDVVVGDRCILHPACVIGSDGFGNAITPDGWVKVPQVGGVRIGSDVEIGACTSVDCGAIDDTIIGDGVRLDNQVQIGHNVVVGDHTAMAAGCGVAGSAVIGKRCMFAGMVGMAGHIEVCDDVIIHGKSMITRNISEPGAYASNFSAVPVRDWNRSVAMVRRLSKLADRVTRLEKKSK